MWLRVNLVKNRVSHNTGAPSKLCIVAKAKRAGKGDYF